MWIHRSGWSLVEMHAALCVIVELLVHILWHEAMSAYSYSYHQTNYCWFMSAMFLVSLAASEEERSRVDQVWSKIPYYTIWWVIFVGSNFHGKSEKALKINFCGFKFHDSSQSRGVALHKRWCNRYTRSISLAIFFVTKPYLQRLGQIAWDRRILVSKTPSAGWQWLLFYCLPSLGGRTAMMFVATPIIMDS